jgi:hypothetical protein
LEAEMRTLAAFLTVGVVVAWGIIGGLPVELKPGSKMPQQISQITR